MILHNIFSNTDYSPEEINYIFSKFELVKFKKNTLFLKEACQENHYWFIQSGIVRSFVLDYDGNEITTQFFTEKNIVIEWSSFLNRTLTTENFEAITDSICWQLDFDSFKELFHHIPTFREQGRSRLANSYFDLKNRNVAMITLTAKQRYLKFISEYPHLIQNIPLKQISTFLGITDTSLSRIRKEISSL